MLNKLLNLFKRSEPVNPQITDSVTQTMQAQVAEKIKKPAKPRAKKTK
jgi:hypothetical protein